MNITKRVLGSESSAVDKNLHQQMKQAGRQIAGIPHINFKTPTKPVNVV